MAHPPIKLRPLSLTAARWTHGFWADRAAVCHHTLVPHMGRLMHGPQRIRFIGNFEVAAGDVPGQHRGPKWNDGDFYKWLEAACATNTVAPDPALAAQIDNAIALIARVQDPDGYIHTDVQIRQRAGELATRFANPMDFEMYNMGHLMSAAAVHHEATGKTTLLNVARKAADFLDKHFENPTAAIARHGICPAHFMGLVSLYTATTDRRYLDLAVRLLNMRDLVQFGDDDNQDRLPFRDQREAVGHAVRATYLYAGAADIYAHTADATLLPPLESIWTDLASHKLHITCGCGPLYDGASPDGAADQTTITRTHQSFARPYQLPQSTAHNETCAAIGNLLWNWRMLQITADAKYADVMEQTLFNSLLAGVSLDGKKFFYTNTLRRLNPMPVELRWPHARQEFLSCFCCPPNVARTLAQSHTFAYAQGDRDLWVVLYGANHLDGDLNLTQETNYPWHGDIKITIHSAPPSPVAIHLRIPAWADGATLRVNALPPSSPSPGTPGERWGEGSRFHTLDRIWKPGDVITLHLPMPARLITSHPYVEETRNHVAVMRGPIVYCLESVDLPAGVDLLKTYIRPDTKFTLGTDLALPGLTLLKCHGSAIESSDRAGPLYQNFHPRAPIGLPLRLIPYFAWDNRGDSEMTVWLPLAPL